MNKGQLLLSQGSIDLLCCGMLERRRGMTFVKAMC